jgi:hypothetical protein
MRLGETGWPHGDHLLIVDIPIVSSTKASPLRCKASLQTIVHDLPVYMTNSKTSLNREAES